MLTTKFGIPEAVKTINVTTNTKFGLPLEADSKQTIIPVMEKESFNLIGYFTIAETTFDGTETEYAIPTGEVDGEGAPTYLTPIPITTVTVPAKVNDQYSYGFGVHQYMAAVYDHADVVKRPWLGYSQFITNTNGAYNRWSLPSTGVYLRSSLGILGESLMVGMATVPTVDTVPAEPQAPTANSTATMRWVASINNNANQTCPFFDFNWVTLFNAKMAVMQPSNTVEPMGLTVVSNPASGAFKATLVTDAGIAYVPGGGVQFNTVRILRLNNATPGAHVFNFNVVAKNGLSTPVELTLTVV